MTKYIIEKEIEGGMMTWDGNGEIEASTKIVEFMKEYEDLCKKHNITLSHEDSWGSFLFEDYDEENIKWVCHGQDYTRNK